MRVLGVETGIFNSLSHCFVSICGSYYQQAKSIKFVKINYFRYARGWATYPVGQMSGGSDVRLVTCPVGHMSGDSLHVAFLAYF